VHILDANIVTEAERIARSEWVARHSAPDGEAPFSFDYGGKPWADIRQSWHVQRHTRAADDRRLEHTLSYRDPATALELRCVAVEYLDFPTVEWTLYFKNAGVNETPILANIQALDMHVQRSVEGEFLLHHHVGSPCKPYDYMPIETVLQPKADVTITTSGGRSSNSDFPYLNLEWPSEGVIIVIGWPGQWAARLTRDEGPGLRVQAGMELTHFRLLPGEEVRSPLIVLQFWKGERLRSQNIFRRWMLAHNLPRSGGQPPTRSGGQLPPPHLAACSSHQYGEMVNADEASQILFIDRYLEEGLKLDYWWMDAGWYPGNGWPNTGTWEVDKKRFPRGLRAITDHAHERSLKAIVWFEPERVTPGTWLYEQHPEWLLGADGETKLLNLGKPEARHWLTEHIDRFLVEQGVDLYRQDFNMDPLPYWRANDAWDRQGITEIGHIAGYLAYWDELRRRHPAMLIDSCASGGRRNDLETLRRAVPLLRSDYIFEPLGQQCHTYGLSFWLPAYGSGMISSDAYIFRSVLCPFLNACWDVRRKDLDYAAMRELVAEWREIAPFLLGDYYPLTPYSLGNDVWMAWQFDRPDLGEGMALFFRRDKSPTPTIKAALQGLNPQAEYEMSLSITPGQATRKHMSGKELTGLTVTLPEAPASALLRYRRRATRWPTTRRTPGTRLR